MHLVLKRGIRDFWSAIRQPQIWVSLGLRSVRYSYRRTILGPWWHSVDQLVFTLGFGYINSWLFGSNLKNSFTYVGLGILGFSQISQMLLSGSQCLITSTQLRYAQIPIVSRMLKSQLESLIIFAHRALPMLIILMFTGSVTRIRFIESILGLTILTWWGVAASLILGPIGARFRDIQPMVSLLLRLALFATPIFWNPNDGTNNIALIRLANWNPFSLMIEVVRSPLLGNPVSSLHLFSAIFLVATTTLIGTVIFSTFYHRIQYWL